MQSQKNWALKRGFFFFAVCFFLTAGFGLSKAYAEGAETAPEEATSSSKAQDVEASPAVSEAGPAEAKPDKAMPLLEELKHLKTNISELQQNIQAFQQKLAVHPTEAGASGKKPFVKTYVSLFVEMLEERMIELGKGLRSLVEHVRSLLTWQQSWALWMELGILLISFGGSTLLGVLCGVAAYRWLTRGLKNIFKWALLELKEKPQVQKVASVVFDLFVALLPVFLLVFVQVSAFFVIEGVPALRNAMFSFASGLLLWLSAWRVQETLFQHLPNDLFNPGAARVKRALTMYVQLLFFFWIVNDWMREIFVFSDMPYESSVVVMFVFGAGMATCAMGVVQALKKPLLRWIKSSQEKQFPLLTTLFWMLWNSFPVLLYLLFVLDETVFANFFMPTLLTVLLLPGIPLFYRMLRRLRMRYLWVHRRDSSQGVFYRFLKPKERAYFLCYLLSYGVFGLVLIELWDLRFFQYLKFFVGGQIYDQLADVLLLLLGAWFAVHFGDRILRYYLERRPLSGRTDQSFYIKGRMRTLLMTSRTILRVTVAVVFSLITLASLGFNITPIVTNLGLFSAVFAFGMQSFVKDFFAGLLSLLDNNVAVGDWVDIDGRLGIVEELTLRTIKVRTDAGTLLTVPFGSIKVIGNRSRHFSRFLVNLPTPYDVDPTVIQKLMEQAFQNLKKQAVYRRKVIGNIDIRGINDICDYAMVFQARVQTMPTTQEFVRRGYNRHLKELLDSEGIRIPTPPYPQNRDTLLSVSGRLFPKK